MTTAAAEDPISRGVAALAAQRRLQQALERRFVAGEYDHVTVWLEPVSPLLVKLGDIVATPMHAGHGTRAMRALIAAADECGLSLTLEVATADDNPDGLDEDELPSEDDLVRFYERFGFTVSGQGLRVRMSRVATPKAVAEPEDAPAP